MGQKALASAKPASTQNNLLGDAGLQPQFSSPAPESKLGAAPWEVKHLISTPTSTPFSSTPLGLGDVPPTAALYPSFSIRILLSFKIKFIFFFFSIASPENTDNG